MQKVRAPSRCATVCKEVKGVQFCILPGNSNPRLRQRVQMLDMGMPQASSPAGAALGEGTGLAGGERYLRRRREEGRGLARLEVVWPHRTRQKIGCQTRCCCCRGGTGKGTSAEGRVAARADACAPPVLLTLRGLMARERARVDQLPSHPRKIPTTTHLLRDSSISTARYLSSPRPPPARIPRHNLLAPRIFHHNPDF
ncbi:hypothetical protein GGTG_07112 [Gaeumannomyces tritici R3-111a-1]|uniref:Uncharacterized protein n=1 Tax=Gaeumannomyces tritici (strain R3-111a-1) TaxID=644352 RepID=J3P0R7_GAET3|nr:hypothetical protein GGTG_07112 [Gaeumannomyces tritici R3-111a-1]EJT77200.1 hypothetical protein GGTG_07112 [Gaeumannomyces tritici R3-111a-1]